MMVKQNGERHSRLREIIVYLLLGVPTTLVDWLTSFVLYQLGVNVHLANLAAWAMAVLFAYVTHRLFVFESSKHGFLLIMGELGVFALGRVATLLMQEGIFLVFHDWLGLNEYVIKLVAAVLVVIGNYFVSKLIVFRKAKKE